MGIEKPQEGLSHESKSLKEYAMDAVKRIQSLGDAPVNISEAFPNMERLTDPKVFWQISDLAQICQWQNNAVDRKATQQYCEVMDPNESPLLSLDHG